LLNLVGKTAPILGVEGGAGVDYAWEQDARQFKATMSEMLENAVCEQCSPMNHCMLC